MLSTCRPKADLRARPRPRESSFTYSLTSVVFMLGVAMLLIGGPSGLVVTLRRKHADDPLGTLAQLHAVRTAMLTIGLSMFGLLFVFLAFAAALFAVLNAGGLLPAHLVEPTFMPSLSAFAVEPPDEAGQMEASVFLGALVRASGTRGLIFVLGATAGCLDLPNCMIDSLLHASYGQHPVSARMCGVIGHIAWVPGVEVQAALATLVIDQCVPRAVLSPLLVNRDVSVESPRGFPRLPVPDRRF